MAERRQTWRTLTLLTLLTLLPLTAAYVLRDEDWEELSPDIAKLHHLSHLNTNMKREQLHRHSSPIRKPRGTQHVSRLNIDQNPMSLLDGFQNREDVAAYFMKKKQDFETFLESFEMQRTQDWLLTASEVSHSYSQQLLVMTDKENSTKDSVQQEYSMDPHYSVIVSKDCLFNESCLPRADGFTLVKILGSVSDDGQRVSGFSGSSLAKLLLSSSLRVAPLFSLNGNTSTRFQQNFMRLFHIRGIRAVLETDQQSHQLYQVMDRPDSVSSYRIPRRPVDHTTQYDHQQIIMMESDPVVMKAAAFLYVKHPEVSSVYMLDQNKRPKLIHGDFVPLSEDSRLVLVGHGGKDASGETRLSGFGAQDVAKVIAGTSRVSDKIKTTSVVACEVGSDKGFIQTLLTDLRKTSIETELHLRDAMVQVQHTGQKITQKISADGLKWRHKDDSTKVVANLDRNGDTIIRTMEGSKGEAVFTNERNLLMMRKRFFNFRDNWPQRPRSFINENIFKSFHSDLGPVQMKYSGYMLEAQTWAFFHAQQLLPQKVNFQNLQQRKMHFIIGRKFKDNNNIERMRWVDDDHDLTHILSKCYEIKSGRDVRNIIRHFAKTGEDESTYLMINDWILEVNHINLYVHPVGKRLNNNEMGDQNKIRDIRKSITQQIGQERYDQMRKHIFADHRLKTETTHKYVQYVEATLKGEPLIGLNLPTEAWFTSYFTASFISESARNFRTFPLSLMALDMTHSQSTEFRDAGLNFFFKQHSMARGGSWIDPSRRGFSGSATHEDSSKLSNREPIEEGQLKVDLFHLLQREAMLFTIWERAIAPVTAQQRMVTISRGFQILQDSDTETFLKYYSDFIEKNRLILTSSDGREPPASGALGGYDDDRVSTQDLKSAAELENSFKLQSHYSRASALFAEEIHSQMKARFGETLGGLRLREGSARIQDGHFICELVSKGAETKPVEFRMKLSPQSLGQEEKVLKGLDAAAHDMEGVRPSHPVNRYVEHTGTAVGTLGLLLGMKGAVDAFEHGDTTAGAVGAAQTAHGVAAMTTSLIARKALTSETRVARAAAAIIRSPAMKGAMTVLPIVGIGFGVYNLEQDIERGGALGEIDAVFDVSMIILDVVELAQPELAPFIMPINLALSVFRMVTDDVYMGVEEELNSLPSDAGVLDKLGAVVVGAGKGLFHFAIHVASVFYDWHYDEIQQGHKLVEQISDYKKYYTVTSEQGGTTAIDFSSGSSSWNGGGIDFCLADRGQSKLCMNYFVSSDEAFGRKCWDINTQGSRDIILGLGESNTLQHKTLQNKILMFIPAGSVRVVSGYEAVSDSRYGIYKGNREANRFFAVDKSEDERVVELMLTYYYQLYGEPGNDVFFLGPQRSYVEGAGGSDTYIIPDNGGKTIINNYDPSKALDTLHFAANYSHLSVSKSGNHLVFMYEGEHTVTVQNWFLGELYRHMNMMSGDGVLFEVSSTVVSSVQLVAKGINKMFQKHGATVNASQPLFSKVTNILGSRFDDVLIGNGEKNVMDGGGGGDRLTGGGGGDIYMVKSLNHSSVVIENYATDNETDTAIIEAELKTFRVAVQGDNVVLTASHDTTAVRVTLLNWFRSPDDRHMLFVTGDMISFTLSAQKADCLSAHTFASCITSRTIDYSKATSPLVVDLEDSEAYASVVEIRGSKFSDNIKGNKEHNMFFPGGGADHLQGRGGEDWYVITPGQGVKYISNLSPDLVMDILFFKEQYVKMTCACDGRNLTIAVSGRESVVLTSWFESKHHQHLQIKTSDGITAALSSNISSCSDTKTLMFPISVDYRNQKPEALNQSQCFRYTSKNSKEKLLCGLRGKVMAMGGVGSVKEMVGSSGFDIMVGNENDNLLDPSTGGALMSGGEGKDTYVIKRGYGDNLMIDNFAKQQETDTVLIDMDFVDGGSVTLNSSSTGDLNVTITTKGEQFKLTLMSYNDSYQNQHLEFQSSDGVSFRLKSLNSTEEAPRFEVEAFKVTLKQSQSDCRLDLGSWQNLSQVHTVQGCPSQSNDILGNDRDNALIGGWKDDTLEGGQGDDTLIGGNGTDILIGGLGDDTLYGEDGDDTMMGNSGRDVFIPGPGADLIDGGPGRDTVLYRGDHEKGQGVYVNLLTGQGRYADAEGDVLKDVETVIGTIYSDILLAGYESSLLQGSDGNDILVSTGNDHLVGGDGSDIYMVAFHRGTVSIDNCAKDNATDVLYLGLGSPLAFDCQVLPDGVTLTFFASNQTAVKIALEGWISDASTCGHLVLVSSGAELSVDKLLEECRFGQEDAAGLISHKLELLKLSGRCHAPLTYVDDLWHVAV